MVSGASRGLGFAVAAGAVERRREGFHVLPQPGGDSGRRVNQLIPGRIHTDRVEEIDLDNAKRHGITVEEQRAKMESGIPAKRYGSPDEFAAGAVFLFSPLSSYTTGATLQVDGGMLRGIV